MAGDKVYIANTNLNTLIEAGYTKVTPMGCTSAENMAVRKMMTEDELDEFIFGECEKHMDCLDCPNFFICFPNELP